MDTQLKTLGTQLRRLRESTDKSCFAVAASTGITPTTIYNLEKGIIENPRIMTVKKLTDYFGVSIDSLFEK